MAKRHYIPVTADVPGVSDAMRAQIRRTIRTALEAQGVDFPCEIDVLVTSDDGIHEINRTMRDVDRPTDVLSFPEFTLTPGELPSPEDADPGTGLVPLGDMVHLARARARAGEGVRPQQSPRDVLSRDALGAAPARLRPPRRGADEAPDARARGSNHVPAGAGEINGERRSLHIKK